MTTSKEELRNERASRIGRFLIDRAWLVAMIVFLQFVSIGVVAWGIAESNSNANKQLETVLDCSSPGGKCFEDQIQASSVGAVLGSISGSVIVMVECVEPISVEQRTDARMEACKRKAEIYQAQVIAAAVQAGAEQRDKDHGDKK